MAFFKNNIIEPFILILVVTFIFYLLCEFLIYGIISFYFWSQKKLIEKSGHSNKTFIGKLLIVNLRLYKLLVRFFLTIEPFHFDKNKKDDIFNPRLNASTSKKNFVCVFICLVSAIVINLTLNNLDSLKEVYNTVIEENIFNHIGSFLWENKWIILSALGISTLLFSVFKDKFTNKIITEIHDEELKNILITHKDMYADFVTLRNLLCKNINHFLTTPKDNGKLYILYTTLSGNFSRFDYDTRERSFKVLTEKSWRPYHPLGQKTYRYENILDITTKMKERIAEFKRTNPFYNTSAINKYVSGLHGFDISRAVQRKDEKHLLCEELFKKVCEEYPAHTVDILNNEEFDDEFKIKELNDLLAWRNNWLIDTTLETIEYVVNLEEYICKFSKAFALKTRRKELPVETILDKYK